MSRSRAALPPSDITIVPRRGCSRYKVAPSVHRPDNAGEIVTRRTRLNRVGASGGAVGFKVERKVKTPEEELEKRISGYDFCCTLSETYFPLRVLRSAACSVSLHKLLGSG
ncbi:hypothetical protein K0M31_016816 [Melipona bicolor]|uniref:Uncharacterized protein n=1 Tax=Melipona bicolor TaxID=60889 RepID=A0AA40FE15_9HYME|nr:hypothetical protein K0M31_016816 [Melipona bicolor]